MRLPIQNSKPKISEPNYKSVVAEGQLVGWKTNLIAIEFFNVAHSTEFTNTAEPILKVQPPQY